MMMMMMMMMMALMMMINDDDYDDDDDIDHQSIHNVYHFSIWPSMLVTDHTSILQCHLSIRDNISMNLD